MFLVRSWLKSLWNNCSSAKDLRVWCLYPAPKNSALVLPADVHTVRAWLTLSGKARGINTRYWWKSPTQAGHPPRQKNYAISRFAPPWSRTTADNPGLWVPFLLSTSKIHITKGVCRKSSFLSVGTLLYRDTHDWDLLTAVPWFTMSPERNLRDFLVSILIKIAVFPSFFGIFKKSR